MQNATQKSIFAQCKHFATLYFYTATPFTRLPGDKAKCTHGATRNRPKGACVLRTIMRTIYSLE